MANTQPDSKKAVCAYCRMFGIAYPYWPNDPEAAAQKIIAYHRGDWLKAWRLINHVWKLNLRKFGDKPKWETWIDNIRQVRKHVYRLKFSGENPVASDNTMPQRSGFDSRQPAIASSTPTMN